MTTVYKIFVVDDHPIMRRGYASLINREPDLAVCGEAGNAADALTMIPAATPDLVIADLSMPGMSGLELIKQLQARQPALPVLVVSMHDESLYAERALRAGARGYIMKSEADTLVVSAIRAILEGGFYLSSRMSTKILLQYTGRSPGDARSPFDRLSDRELEVLELIGQGYSTRRIAETLHISGKTVESHRGRIKTKLALDSSEELLQCAMQWMRDRGLV